MTTTASVSPDDYVLSEEDVEMKQYTDMLNIFIIYYNSVYNKNQNLFSNIDYEDESSTNRQLEMFYDEVNKHKTLDEKFITMYDSTSYKEDFGEIPDIPLYRLEFNKDSFYTHSLISILSFLVQNDWENTDWNIVQVNSY